MVNNEINSDLQGIYNGKILSKAELSKFYGVTEQQFRRILAGIKHIVNTGRKKMLTPVEISKIINVLGHWESK